MKTKLSKRNIARRATAIMLTFIMLTGLMTTMVLVSASGVGSDTPPVALMHAGAALQSGSNLSGTLVSYGFYNGQPLLWRVVDEGSGSFTLWSTQSLGSAQYNHTRNHELWSGSWICGWLNGSFMSETFVSAEQNAIHQAYGTQNEPFPVSSNSRGTIDTRQRIVLPSADEVRDDGIWGLTQASRSFGSSWWLRSPSGDLLYPNSTALAVTTNGLIPGGVGQPPYVTEYYNIRPVFRLNTANVVFTSPASGAGRKNDVEFSSYLGSVAAPGDSGGGGGGAISPAVKLTLQDPSLTLGSVTPTFVDGRTITFSYSGATPGANLSAIVLCRNGTLKHYGRLVESTSPSGTASVTVPYDFENTDRLEIFVEQVNDDHRTDFAGERRQIPVIRPDAPAGLSGISCTTHENNDGQIRGVSIGQEYIYGTANDGSDGSIGLDRPWIPITSTPLTGLGPGPYQVRTAANIAGGTVFLASPATEVIVGEFDVSASPPVIISADNHEHITGTEDDSFYFWALGAEDITFTLQGAPSGVTLEPHEWFPVYTAGVRRRLIVGADVPVGVYTFTVHAENTAGSTTQQFTLTMINYCMILGDHEWLTVITPPTCTEDGFTTRYCIRTGCDHTETVDRIAALGHDWESAFTD